MSCKYGLIVIPARAGSKRLPNKNILSLAGKPLVEWAIIAAIEVQQVLDVDVVVTSDDERVLHIAGQYPAVVCLSRNAALSTDHASSMDVLFDALQYCERQGKSYHSVTLLQPTSPLRTSEDVVAALRLFDTKNADAIVSVCECEHSPLWSNVIPRNDSMDGFMRGDVLGKRSQDLPTYYRLNGAIYIAKTDVLKRHQSFFNLPESYAFKMDITRSVDIDNDIDFELASILMTKKVGEN